MQAAFAPCAPGPSPVPTVARPLRVACVTETWPPEVNGVATTIARMVQGLRERGHRVQVVRPRQCDDDHAGADESLVRGWPIPRYPQLRMGLPAVGTLMRQWSQWRPDVVHVATEDPLGWAAVRAARRLGLPVTSDFRTNFHAYSVHYGLGWMRRPIEAWLRAFHNRCGCTLVPTEPLRRELEAAGFERIRVVARGVDTGLFDPARRDRALRASWGAGDDDPVVAFVGRLAAEKNLELLLLAFAALREHQPHARLVLVGDGPMRAALETAAPWARFAGVRRGTELAAHYASADLFVFPSLTETFGNVTLEAMASGLPVLAFDHAAAAGLIRDGVSGALVPPGDAGAFVRRAVELAADAGLRRTMAAWARARALEQDWPTVIGHLEDQLHSVLAPARPMSSAPAARVGSAGAA